MAARERELHAEFAALATKRIFTRIGINTTSAAVGFVGSEHLFNFTALGDGINLASRLEGANKMYHSQIMLSETTATLVRDRFLLRKLDVLRVKGKKQPMPVYELLAERPPTAATGTATADLEAKIRAYEDALAAYQAQKWDAAEQKLLELCARFGEDGPAQALLDREKDFRAHPPAADWDGVYVSTTK
jgi:adenylate cyclase